MKCARLLLSVGIFCVVGTARDAADSASVLLDCLPGTWDVVYEYTDKSGRAQHSDGRVEYHWILAGEALQETWSASKNGHPQPFGTTVNYLDRTLTRWTAVWIYPSEGVTQVMTGAAQRLQLVLTGKNASGELERWITDFSDPDAIDISLDVSSDAGLTWRRSGTSQLRNHRRVAAVPKH
jgi:hypothetical protein